MSHRKNRLINNAAESGYKSRSKEEGRLINGDAKDDGEGGSGSDNQVLFNTAMAVAPAVAALSHGKSYAAAHQAALVKDMEGYVAALEAEASLDIGPAPGGTNMPDTYGDGDFSTRRKANQINPNQAPKTSVSTDGYKEVVLEENYMHAYMTRGKINGESVLFLLDTGATQVSIPLPVANRLGLQGSGNTSMVQTASGTVAVQDVMLDTLSVGDIQMNYVAAVINPMDRGDTILLGMSALKRVQFIHDDGKLTLRQKK